MGQSHQIKSKKSDIFPSLFLFIRGPRLPKIHTLNKGEQRNKRNGGGGEDK